MRRFTFSLESALRLRERKFETEEIRLRAINAEWEALLVRQQQLAQEVNVAENRIRNPDSNLQSAEFQQLDHFRIDSSRQRLKLAQNASEISRRLAAQQMQLNIANRDRELLIKLKESSKARWQADYDKEQQALAEEVFISRWNQP